MKFVTIGNYSVEIETDSNIINTLKFSIIETHEEETTTTHHIILTPSKADYLINELQKIKKGK